MDDLSRQSDDRIRPLHLRDRAAVRRLGAALFAPYGDYRSALDAWLRHPNLRGQVAESRAGHTVGFVLVATRLPGLRAGVGYVLGIGVDDRRQHRGLGRRLLEAAIDDLEGSGCDRRLDRLQLTVAESNVAARALFDRLGFVRSAATKTEYGSGQPAISMERPLGL